MLENYIVENAEEIVVNISRQNITEVTSSLHEFFTGSDFSSYVCALFNVSREPNHPKGQSPFNFQLRCIGKF